MPYNNRYVLKKIQHIATYFSRANDCYFDCFGLTAQNIESGHDERIAIGQILLNQFKEKLNEKLHHCASQRIMFSRDQEGVSQLGRPYHKAKIGVILPKKNE